LLLPLLLLLLFLLLLFLILLLLFPRPCQTLVVVSSVASMMLGNEGGGRKWPGKLYVVLR
jgi:hypothetical protein